MSFLAGAFLAPSLLVFLGAIPVVVLLYILKLRRTEVVISSTMLWRKSLQDLTANAPFQRLRKNLLLLLQVLVLLLLALALARPFVLAEGTRGGSLCLLIDHSASMQTREGEQTRLELAQAQALDLIDAMERGDQMMVVSFSDTARVLCELTENKHRLRDAVRSVTPSDTPTRIGDAISIIRSLAPDNRDLAAVVSDLEIVLLSDGRLSDVEQLGTVSRRIHYMPVGTPQPNAGIVRFSVRRAEEGMGTRQAFVLAYNDGDAPLATTLTLDFDSNVLAVEELEIPAKQTAEAIFELPELEAGVLRASLDVDDALAVDNQAWHALRPEAYVRVLLVSEPEAMGAYFLRKVLAIDPRVKLETATPADYAASPEYDLVLFNAWSPEALPPQAAVFFNAVPPVPGLAEEGVLEQPPVLAPDRRHPVMRFLNPGNVVIAKALRLRLPEGGRSLLSTESGALIADVSLSSQQVLVVAFDIGDSNWPLHLSFPLFVQNLISWVPRSSLSGEEALNTGEPIELLPVEGVEAATVTLPDGGREQVALDPLRPVYFGQTGKVGAYRVDLGEVSVQYAVNLADQTESAVAPAATLPVGEGEIAAVRTNAPQYKKDLWPWFAAAALALLCVEWWVYCYRAHY